MLQQALNNPDQNIVVLATLTQIGQTEYSPKGAPFQKCRLNDGQTEQPVRIYQGRGQPIPPDLLGQRQSFNLSGYKTQYGAGISGFWNSTAQVAQIPQQPRGNIQPNHQPVPTRDTGVSTERQCAFESACTFYAGRADIDQAAVLNLAKAGAYFIETGKNLLDTPDPNQSITEPEYQPTVEEAPF